MTRIIVCGAGTMGSGIAETAARSGFKTLLFDPQQEAIDRAANQIRNNLNSLYEKQKISSSDIKDINERVSFTTDISECAGELVIEAIIEDIEIKKKLFHQIAEINTEETILASNTSSLSITEIAKAVPHPGRFCGMHFFNPATLMKLVEIVRTEATDPGVIEKTLNLAVAMGKTPVVCKDSPGFIVNRVARHYYLEALELAEKGICEFAQADRLMENAGFKMGPFKLMDLIGNDINFAVTRSLYEAYGKAMRFRPSAIQEEKIRNGELGRKTGKGYYTY